MLIEKLAFYWPCEKVYLQTQFNKAAILTQERWEKKKL